MHETLVAENLLATISAEAAKLKGKPISAKISCGMLNAINDEVLFFAFEAISKGTMCEGMRLEVEHKPVLGRCKRCAEVFGVELSRPTCSKCGSEEFELLPDAPLVLETIEFETE